MSLLDNAEFVQDLKSNLSGAEIARKWDCAESTARQHRINILGKEGIEGGGGQKELAESREVDAGGNIIITKRADRIIPLTEWLQGLLEEGLNPDDYTTSHGHSIYEQHTRAGVTKVLYANKFSATKRVKKGADGLDSKAILESVRDVIDDFRITVPVRFTRPQTLVVCASDLQVGKVDINGGTEDTARQVLNSFAHAADIARTERPAEIVIVDAGDVIENENNVASQRATNDLGLPHQVEAATRIMLAGIKMLAPLTSSLKYVAVPSNHGRNRSGFKQEVGDAHDDYGIAIAKIIRNALTLNDDFSHVEIVLPGHHLESLAFETSGSQIGVVHGHQASRPEALGDWWRGQALGNGPVGNARILICGHYHSLRMQTEGDDRTLFVCPASDRGSSWYTNLKGQSSRSGMLSFLTADNQWSRLEVL